MRRYAATCDDCPDWTYVAATERDASRRAERHASDAHGEDLRVTDMNGFVRAHSALAHHFARRAGVHDGESYDDVYADALIGLWDAAKRYDPARGCTFSAFAGRRIAGAIGDGRRQRDPLSRTCRRAGEMSPLTLDMQLSDTPDAATLGALLPDPRDDYAAFEDADEYSQRLAAVHTAAESLNAKQRHVLLGRLNGERLGILAGELGVTESRASQMESEAVRRLRHVLKAA